MPMTMNVDEAGSRFRDIVLTIERNPSPHVIMDGDRPVAQIIPVPTRRKIVTIPELAGSISKEDPFSGDSELWEAAPVVTSDEKADGTIYCELTERGL